MRKILAVAGFIMFAAAWQTAQAQQQVADPRLVQIVTAAQEGQSENARADLRQLLSQLPTSDPVYPQALYASGLIAGNSEEARRSFQRVVVEYGYTEWADDALLRLAQLSYASSDPQGTIRSVERLARDFPASTLLAGAAYWGARAAIDLNDEAGACSWVARGLDAAAANGDVESSNQLTYFSGRCANVTPEQDEGGASAPTGPVYRVQVAALSTQEAADRTAGDLRRWGYEVQVVRDGGLFKVRAGRFTQRGEADEAVSIIRSRLGGSPFVVTEE